MCTSAVDCSRQQTTGALQQKACIPFDSDLLKPHNHFGILILSPLKTIAFLITRLIPPVRSKHGIPERWAGIQLNNLHKYSHCLTQINKCDSIHRGCNDFVFLFLFFLSSFLMFCINHGGNDVVSQRVGPRWWQIHALRSCVPRQLAWRGGIIAPARNDKTM